MRYKNVIGLTLLLVVAGTIIFCIAAGLTPKIGNTDSASKVNAMLHVKMAIPETASNIDYYSSVFRTEVAFDLSESEFLSWCKREDWTIIELSTYEPRLFIDPVHANRSVICSNGWEGRGGSNAIMLYALYSRDVKRAYVHYSER